MAISICIPTKNRSEMLIRCIRSVFNNDTRPIELIISYDHGNHDNILNCRNFICIPNGISIKEISNLSEPGQSINTNNAFSHASKPFVSLMHDDDFFLDNAIDILYEKICYNHDVDCVYGRQIVVNENECFMEDRTLRRQSYKFHHTEHSGLVSPLWAALSLQLPNNGYIIRKTLLDNTRFPSETEVGLVPVDYFFGICLAQQSTGNFLFIAQDTSAVRLTTNSVLRSQGQLKPVTVDTYKKGCWDRLQSIQPLTNMDHIGLNLAKSRIAPRIIEQCILQKHKTLGLKILATNIHTMQASRTYKAKLTFALFLLVIGGTNAAKKFLILKIRRARKKFWRHSLRTNSGRRPE